MYIYTHITYSHKVSHTLASNMRRRRLLLRPFLYHQGWQLHHCHLNPHLPSQSLQDDPRSFLFPLQFGAVPGVHSTGLETLGKLRKLSNKYTAIWCSVGKQLECKFSSVKSEVHLKLLGKKIINGYTMDGWTMKKKCNSG